MNWAARQVTHKVFVACTAGLSFFVRILGGELTKPQPVAMLKSAIQILV